MQQFRGVVPAVVTPFDRNWDVDHGVLADHIEFLISKGVHGIAVCGSTGEYESLSVAERKAVYRTATRVARDRVFVLAGLGGFGTREAIELAHAAEESGCHGLLLLPPYYYAFGRAEIVRYYCDVAAATRLPIVIYNNPGKTHVDLTPDLVAELCSRCENIRYIKESSADVRRVLEIEQLTGGKVVVFSGWDSITLEALLAGARGIISGSANAFPELTCRLWHLGTEGNLPEALSYYRRVRRILVLLEDHGRLAAWIKGTMRLLGRDVGLPRPPYLPVSREEEELIRRTLEEVGLL